MYHSAQYDRRIAPDVFGTRYYWDNSLGRLKQLTPIMIIRKSGTGLLRTCKQVNEEATDILHGVNTFAFSEPTHPVRAESYLELPEERQLLRRLLLYGGTNDIVQMKDFLNLIGASNAPRSDTSRLKSIRTQCFSNMSLSQRSTPATPPEGEEAS